MKGNERLTKVSLRAWGLLVFLALGLAVAAPVRADLSCEACHTMPPTDTLSERNPATGAFKGNHQGHSSNTVASCIPCHGAGASSYAADHSAVSRGTGTKMVISLTASLNNYSIGHARASYSRGTFFNQTSVPPNPLGTCSNVSCHFEKTTPAWGSAVFTSPNDCDKCHEAPPASIDPGSHAKHNTYYPGVTYCQKCHSNNTTFQHSTSAGKRPLAISFAAAPNNGSGAYDGPLDDYLPSKNQSFGKCTSTYCHSTGRSSTTPNVNPAVTATWGNNGTLGCVGCHASPVSVEVGSHYAHVSTTYAVPVACYKCHAATVTSGMTIFSTTNHVNKKVDIAFSSKTTAILGKYSGHLTPMQKTPGSGYAKCENVYCHSSGQGAGGSWPPTYSSPKWGELNHPNSGTCGTCHGSSVHVSVPLTSGSHTKHLLYEFDGARSSNICGTCHWGAGFASPTCGQCHLGGGKLTTLHVNHKVDVSFTTKFNASYSGTPEPGDGYGACSNSYCHSDGKATPTIYTTPTWGNVASGACGTCHGVTAAAPPASTPHADHVGNAKPYLFACSTCHSSKVQATANSTIQPTYTNLTSHVNIKRDVKFNSASPFGSFSSATLSCRNVYCHSTGNLSVTSGSLPAVYNGKVYTRQTWSGTLACNGCHGRSTSNGMPDYTNGKMGSMSSNSHPKHVISSNIPCVECHEKTTKNNTSIRGTIPSKHVNATNHDVYFNLSGNSAAGTYNNVPRTCTATYCHGAGASLSWGGRTQCNSCHSANDAVAGGGGINNWGAGISAHTLHVEDTAILPSKYTNYSAGNLSASTTTYRFGCASCHNPAQAAHVNGYASGTYRAQVFFGYTSPGKKPTYTYNVGAGTADNGFAWSTGSAVCNSTYCHSDGNGGAGTAVSWATTASSTTVTRCKLCHAYTTASGTLINTYKHAKHVTGTTYSFSCARCHNLTTNDGSTIADKTKHVNKKKDVAWDSVNSDGSAYVNSTTACANIYCHSQGTTFTQPYTGTGKAPVTAVTWSGGQTLGCNGCHGNANGYTAGSYRIATPLYVSGTPKGNAHQLHVDARLGTDAGTQCLHCHNTTTTNNTAIAIYANHVNEGYTIAAGSTYANGDAAGGAVIGVTVGYTYNAAGSTCSNVSCHPTGLSGSKATDVVPWNDKHSCDDCHSVNMKNNTGYHHAMRNYSGSAAAYPKTIPGVTAGANDISRRCTMCHVDHNTFSPNLNAGNTTYGSAGNLRMSIISSVTVTKGYINRDFYKTGSGGICVSCHNTELFKDTGNVRVKNEANSTKTSAIVLNSYTGSAHEYAINSTMKRDSKIFYSDCSKCHNGRKGETAAFSSITTATHDNSARRIYADLGTTIADGNDENFCYRCHSQTSDAVGGTKKPVNGKDYYNTQTMSSAAEKIYALFQKANKHNVAGYTGIHKPSPNDETQAYMTANRHVECADCHNPHSGTSASPMRGVWGLDPTTPAAGSTPAYSVTTITDPDHQYKVCFKCHTNWAGYGTGTTNLAVDFNTANDSFHWVEKDKYTYTVNSGTAKGIWQNAQFNMAAVPTQGTKTYVEVMMPRTGITYDNATLRTLALRCSDCHGSDNADGGVNVPEGPHGSTIANILKVPAGSPYTAWNATTSSLTGDTWCLNCHDPAFGNSGFRPSAGHLYGGSGKHQRACQFCHLAIPHGSGSEGAGAANQRKHLLKPATFTEGIDSETSGSQSQHGSWVIPGCT